MSEQKLPIWSRPVAAALAISLGMTLAGCRGGDPATLMAEARHYRDQGDIKAAVIQLKNVIQHDADNRSARLLLGELYLDQGDPQSAEKELRRALALGADSASVNVMLGRALLMQGQYERILADIVPGSAPATRPPILALRGNALLGMTKVEPARELFNEALALNPASPDALLGLARIAMWNKQPELGRSLLARALAANPADVDCLHYHADLLRAEGKGDAALAELNKVLKHHPHSAQTLVDIANIHSDAGRFSQARSTLASARKVAGTSLGLIFSEATLDFRENKLQVALDGVQKILRVAPEHYPSVLLAGAIHSALGAPQPAELELRKFLQAYPGHPYASKLLAAAYLGSQRPAEALLVLKPLLAERPDDADLLALAGEASLRARDFSAAGTLFEKASALQPARAALHTGLALSRMGSGDNARALAELERAAALEHAPAVNGVLLVMSYLRENEPDKALKAVLEMEKQGDNPLIQNLKGGIFLARQDLPAARASFERALRFDPAYLPALSNLAQIDRVERKTADTSKRYLAALTAAPRNSALLEALSDIALAAGNPTQAIAYMERAVADHPDSLPLALRTASLYLQAGQQPKALVLARRLQSANPASAEALALLAQAYAMGGNYAQAADSYSRLSALTPRAANPHLRLATVRIAQQQFGPAEAALRKALALDPAQLEARITLINLLVRQSRFPDAHAVALQAQKLFPQAAAGFKLEGDVRSAQGEHGAALKSYEMALAAAPNGAVVTQVYGALLKLGRAAEADARLANWFREHPADVPTRLYYASSKLVRDDPRGAIPHFEAVLKYDPGNLAALNDLAWSYQRAGDPRALATAQRAYRLAPANPSIIDTLGWIYLEGGQLPQALPLLKRAAALAPRAAEIRFHYAQALVRSGDKKGARHELEKALALPQPFARRNEAQALLGTL